MERFKPMTHEQASRILLVSPGTTSRWLARKNKPDRWGTYVIWMCWWLTSVDPKPTPIKVKNAPRVEPPVIIRAIERRIQDNFMKHKNDQVPEEVIVCETLQTLATEWTMSKYQFDDDGSEV